MTPDKRLCLVQDARRQIQLMLRMDMYPKVSNASHVMHKYLKSQKLNYLQFKILILI